MIDAAKVRAAVHAWRRGDDHPLDGLTEPERAVALVALGYDTYSHAEMVGIPRDWLPAARQAAQTLGLRA